MGDGIMAVFGAPLEQPDHADRALAAATEMIGPRLDRFNDWLAEQGHDHRFAMGVGLNSGPVMAGNIGAEQRVEYTALGDTTNTASRLEGMTKGSGHMLFIADSTRERLRNPPDSLVARRRARGAWTRSQGAGVDDRVAARRPMSRPSGSPRQAIDASLGEGQARGRVAGDAMHPAAGEGRRAAEVQPPQRRAVGGEGRERAEEQLVQRVAAPAHVSVDQVRRCDAAGPPVRGRDGRGSARESPARSALPPPPCAHVPVALGLPVDRVRAVRVCPSGVLALRSAGGVGDRLLTEQHEGTLGQLPAIAARSGAPRAATPAREPCRPAAPPVRARGSDRRVPSRP